MGAALGAGSVAAGGYEGLSCEEERASEADTPGDPIGPAHTAPFPDPAFTIKRTSSKQAVLEACSIFIAILFVSAEERGWSIPFGYNWNNYPIKCDDYSLIIRSQWQDWFQDLLRIETFYKETTYFAEPQPSSAYLSKRT